MRATTGCVVSKSDDEVQCSHLMPKADAAWFRREGVGRCVEVTKSKNKHNTMAIVVVLWPALHKAFDKLKWAFVR
jgi:hypothetical protein